eukprot:TRINITY_DN2696_c1_g1_i1.p1 TRINITY_DN2696_c1_g1~~TRINITY_DN2696_c1_g1_i1.p1  ORF type:complete len:447 (-),score=73.85 TRINITY_DN2696_c1_g1_i1:188-1528(-)
MAGGYTPVFSCRNAGRQYAAPHGLSRSSLRRCLQRQLSGERRLNSMLLLAVALWLTSPSLPLSSVGQVPAPPTSALEMFLQVSREVAIPLTALLSGALCHQKESWQTPAKLMIYFGAQTGMLLLAKVIISGAVVSEELGLKGLPAAFLLTAMQQMTSFVVMGPLFVLSWATPWPYTPKTLTSRQDAFRICVFAASFAANIGLNNFSLAYLPLSLNLIIRSCLPLATVVVQSIIELVEGGKGGNTNKQELICMLAGVSCAGLATVAQMKANKNGSIDVNENLLLGVMICFTSIFAGALNMVLASSIGKSLKMNSIDMTFYMGPPATAILLVPSFYMSHPSWPGQPSMTDFEVMAKVWDMAPQVVGLAFVLGICASGYNALQYGLVQALSATYTAFAGNFNKATTVAISIAAGLERLPAGVWGTVMLLATLGNIGSFTAYSLLTVKKK